MKIVQFTQPGPPEVLKYIDAPVPEPKAGEVLVRAAHSIGVGMPDTRIRAGTYPQPLWSSSFTMDMLMNCFDDDQGLQR